MPSIARAVSGASWAKVLEGSIAASARMQALMVLLLPTRVLVICGRLAASYVPLALFFIGRCVGGNKASRQCNVLN